MASSRRLQNRGIRVGAFVTDAMAGNVPCSIELNCPAGVGSPRQVMSSMQKCALIMPIYPSTLHHMERPVDEAIVLQCGLELKPTLQAIHKKDYGHNDIKASNIFLDQSGELISCSHTSIYWEAASKLDTHNCDYNARRDCQLRRLTIQTTLNPSLPARRPVCAGRLWISQEIGCPC